MTYRHLVLGKSLIISSIKCLGYCSGHHGPTPCQLTLSRIQTHAHHSFVCVEINARYRCECADHIEVSTHAGPVQGRFPILWGVEEGNIMSPYFPIINHEGHPPSPIV